MKNTNRNEEIDILKALGIICMVAGHSSAPLPKIFLLFHMSIFFIASGFFYKEHYSNAIENVKIFILKKIKSLWLPYFICNSCYILLNNVFIRLNIYTDNIKILTYRVGMYTTISEYYSVSDMLINIIKSTYFSGCTILASGFWFVKTLFFISIGYCICDFFIKKIFKRKNIFIQTIISVIFLLLGYYLHINNIPFFGLDKILSYYILFFMGHIISIYTKKINLNKNKIYYVIIMIFSLSLLLISRHFGHISLDLTEYTNPLFFILVSFFGWCFFYSSSMLIKKYKIKIILLEIGKRTISILIFHLLCMKPVAYLVCLYYKLPLFCVAAHPNIYGDKGIWWIAYTVFGVLIPVCLSIIIEKIKNINNKKFT